MEEVLTHKPVLLEECIQALNIRPDGIYLDGTLGRAGHSREIARRLTTGRLICVDRDQAALEEGICAAFVLIAALAAALCLAAFAGVDWIIAFLKVPAGVRGVMREYLVVIFWGIAATFLYNFFASLLRALGNSAVPLVFLAVSAVLNIALDPVFIFGLDMGVAGAAVATVIGQISGACIGFFLLWRIRREFSVSFRGFRPSGALSGEMLRIAAPAIVMQSLSSFMSLGLNQLLTLWSQTGVFVLGVYFKIQTFVFMPIFGVSNGLIPILSYNYGARSPGRITRSIRFRAQLRFTAVGREELIYSIFFVHCDTNSSIFSV